MNAVGPSYLPVSHLWIQQTTDQKQYFFIPSCGFPIADWKYCFLSFIGWICGCEGPTVVKSGGSEKLYMDFWLCQGGCPLPSEMLKSKLYISCILESTGKHKHVKEKHGRYKKIQIEFPEKKNPMSKEKTHENYLMTLLVINMEVLSFNMKCP